MKPVLICTGVFLASIVLMIGEAGWIFLVCAFVLWIACRSDRLVTILVAGAAGGAILTAQFAGYKVYGSATIHDNRPVLHSPRQMASLAFPNTVLTADGGRLEVRGVMFNQQLLDFPMADLRALFLQRSAGSIFVEADPGSPSGIVFEKHLNYWCGNTFFPTFFPTRLPAYSRVDLGKYLVECKLATAADLP